MEKKVYELTIDLELRDLIPPLAEDEYRLLEDSILRSGCDTPLTVWHGTIVDGHNRYEICQRYGIPFAYEERAFESKEAAMFWMLERQLARRNLNSYQRSVLALKYEPLFRKRAAFNRRYASIGRSPKDRKNVITNPISTRDELAKMAGISHSTIDKVGVLEREADAETRRKLMNGQISIHQAFIRLSRNNASSHKGNAHQSSEKGISGQGINAVVLSDQLPGGGIALQNAHITVVLTDESTYKKIMGLVSQNAR